MRFGMCAASIKWLLQGLLPVFAIISNIIDYSNSNQKETYVCDVTLAPVLLNKLQGVHIVA